MHHHEISKSIARGPLDKIVLFNGNAEILEKYCDIVAVWMPPACVHYDRVLHRRRINPSRFPNDDEMILNRLYLERYIRKKRIELGKLPVIHSSQLIENNGSLLVIKAPDLIGINFWKRFGIDT